MAKKNVGVIEKHFEKVILGVAVLALLAIMVMYLVSNPHTVEFAGQTYGPSEIDVEVRKRAAALASKMARASEIPGDRLPAPDWEQRLRQFEQGPVQSEGLDATLAWAVPWGRQVKRIKIEQTVQTEQGVALASFEPPFPPEVSFAAIVAVLEQPVAEGEQPAEAFEQDVNLITIQTSYDVAKQRALLQSRYGYDEELANIVYADVEVQRQERIGGDWGEWKPVELYGQPSKLAPPELKVGSDGTLMRDSQRKFTEYRDQLLSGETQQRILLPAGPVPVGGADRAGVQARQVARGDSRGRSRLTDGLRVARDRKPTERRPTRKSDDKEEVTRRRFSSIEEAAKAVEATLAQAEQALQQQDFEQAKTLALDVLQIHQEFNAASQQQVARAQEIASVTPDGKAGPGAAVAGTYQPITQYDITGVPGRTYRYRVRLGILNEYCLAAAKLKDPKDATQAVIYTAWSEPSQPVRVEPDIYFYLAGPAPRNAGVRVEVFKRYHNGWIKESFNVQPGDEIGGLEKVQVTANNQTYREEVDFFTGAVAVDVAHDVEYEPLQITSSSFNLGRSRRSEWLVFMDEDGELTERYSVADKTNPRYLELNEATKKPRKIERKSTARGSERGKDRKSKSRSTRRGYSSRRSSRR